MRRAILLLALIGLSYLATACTQDMFTAHQCYGTKQDNHLYYERR
jgi:hypothetical protein